MEAISASEAQGCNMTREDYIVLANCYIDELKAQLKAKDKEIERLKEEVKEAYIDGSNSNNEIINFYLRKIETLEKTEGK